MDKKEQQLDQLQAIVGQSIADAASPQFALSDRYPKSTVHYEHYRHHIELHIEPKKPQPYLRGLADFLKENLPNNETAKVVERNFCFFAYMLNTPIQGWNDIVQMGEAFLQLKAIVDPFLKKYDTMLAGQMKLAHEFALYYEEQKKQDPFHINVIDELHASENAHSRILVRLLQYFDGNTYSILQTFVSLIPSWDEQGISIANPDIMFNSEHIDVLIQEISKYAIIIENKIHGAQDQNKQIERYVDTAIAHGIPTDKIWALYVTRDGGKVVTDFSLTPHTKRILENRFIPLNYRDDILPWLKNIVLANCSEKEEWLNSALTQYTDHLEGLLEVRPSSIKSRKQLLHKIFETIGVKEPSDPIDIYRVLTKESEKLEAVQQVINGEIGELENSVFHSFNLITKSFFHKRFPSRDFIFNDNSKGGYYQIYPKDWFWGPHLEWIPFYRGDLFTEKQIALRLHIEDQGKPHVKKLVESLLNDEDFKSAKHSWHGTLTKDEFFTLWWNLSKPFVLLSENEQEETLSKIYEEASAIIPILDKHIHSH